MTDDTELQSTVARVLASEPGPGGIGDLHADVTVLRSRLREAVALLRQCVKPRNDKGDVLSSIAAFIAELEREAGK